MFALGKESPAGAFDFDSNPPLEHQKNRLNGGFFGAPAGIRTPDTLLKRQVLCLLSYWGGYISFSGNRYPKHQTQAQQSGLRLKRRLALEV